MAELVQLEVGRVARLHLDNPPLNLISEELLADLDAALATLERSAPGDVRVAVVSAGGERAFSVGSDVKAFERHRGAAGRAHFEREEAVTSRLANLPMPTIAAIEGDALGGGLELALACDMRVVSERARLGLPEVRLAVTPGAGGTQRLPRIVGVARAKEMILAGRLLAAGEAEAIGLVNRVVPVGQALHVAHEMAGEIAKLGPLAVRAAKQLIDRALDVGIDAGLAAELEASGRIFATDDMLEGARAFIEKRSPRYRGS